MDGPPYCLAMLVQVVTVCGLQGVGIQESGAMAMAIKWWCVLKAERQPC